MEKKIQDYLHLLIGCDVLVQGEERTGILTGIMNGGYECEIQYRLLDNPHHLEEEPESANYLDVKPILRPLSDMTDQEIITASKFICAIPNEKEFNYEIQRCHNSVGARFWSGIFTSGQYFSIWNEKNKPGGTGHVEVGWYSDQKIDKRKTRELWKVGGCHELTIYLLKQAFDLFELIPSGLAIGSTTLHRSKH